MKRRYKILSGIAVGCIFIGGILLGTGSAAGGYEQLKTVNDNPLGVTFSGIGLNVSEVDLAHINAVDELLDEADIFRGEKETSGQEVLNGDFSKSISADGLRELEIKVGIHTMTIQEDDVDTITVEGIDCDRIQCFAKGEKLIIKDVGKKKRISKTQGRQIIMTVPTELGWYEADIEAAMASVVISTLQAKEVELSSGMGNIEIGKLTADEANVEAEMGNIIIDTFGVKDLEIRADMGNVEMDGVVERSLDAEANMGAVTLKLQQKKEDFNYEIETSMGSIVLDGAAVGKSGKKSEINNMASRSMDLDASMGSIEISFE